MLSVDDVVARYPWMDLGLYGPPTRPDDPDFWKDADGYLTGAIFSADATCGCIFGRRN